MAAAGYFSADRRAKYGWGTLRLAFWVAFAFAAAPRLQAAYAGGGSGDWASSPHWRATADYLRSWRWLGHAYLGAMGAVVNVEVAPFAANLALLAGGAALCLCDTAAAGPATAVYLLKTFLGDVIAGKLDTAEWRLALAFTVGGLLPAALLAAPGGGGGGALAAAAAHARIFGLLFAAQLACEWGDAHWERHAFWRHRYSFEAATAALLCALPLAPHELAVVQIDLVACWFYRLGNYGLCLAAAAAARAAGGAASRALLAACFRLHFWRRGVRWARVRDPRVARAVLQQSEDKGNGLERWVACPAWAPVLSIESVDGALWRGLRADFNALMRALPPPAALHAAAEARVAALAAGGDVIDAEAVSRLSVELFLGYLFGRPWSPEDQVFVDASWEWRREIAMRGRADPAIKAAAVRRLTEELLPGCPTLWALHGERWREPRCYSLLLQPFIISPAINISDMAVAVARAPPGASAEQAVRLMHPFPILERFCEADVVLDGLVAVPAGTHAIIFTADLSAHSPGAAWPIFGAGPRACPGAALMQPLLGLLQSQLAGLPHFQPERGHRYSGRNNDDGWSLPETLYFIRTFLNILR